MPLAWKALGTTVGIDLAIAVGVFIGFNYLRRLPWMSDFYQAKRKLSIPFRCGPHVRLQRASARVLPAEPCFSRALTACV